VLVAAPARGNIAVVVTSDKRGMLVERTTGRATPLDGAIERAVLIDDRRFAVGLATGTVSAYELARPDRPTTLAAIGAVPIALASTPRWLAAAGADRVLHRIDLPSRAMDRIAIDGEPVGLAVDDDGRVVFGDGARVRAWLGGRIVDLAALPSSVRGVWHLGDRRILVVTEDGSGYSVGASGVTALVAAGSSMVSVGDDLIATFASNHRPTLTEPRTGIAWSIRDRLFAMALSADSRRLYGIRDGRTVMWTFDRPEIGELPGWLDALTNATAPAGPSSLAWR
jgi:hypothetical protein